MTLLDRFIASLPPDVDRPSGEEVIRSLKEMEKQGSNPYFSVIESVADLFLLETEPKRRTILLHGAPNSGKTTFIRHMREIFDGYDHRPAVKFAVDMRRRDAAPALVTSDEWATSNLNKANIDDTKRMLEGEGTLIEQKYVNPYIAFRGAYFILANNTIHRILGSDKEKLDEDELNERGALNARIKRHIFKVPHTNREKVPFDAATLALALKYQASELAEKPDRPPIPQSQYPDFPKPPNPMLYHEPSAQVPPLGAPRRLP